MKIKQIMLKNFASVHEINIEYNQDVTFLIGENGSGKTTVGLNAVWYILEGLALKGKNVFHGDRFRFIGNYGRTATGKLVLHDKIEGIDIAITRRLYKNKTELRITASDKRQLPDTFIDDIFNIFSINPLGFAKLNSKEQAIALGIDTEKYDTLKKIAYDERTELGRNVKRLENAVEEIGPVDKKIEPVDLKKLLKEKDRIDTANSKIIEKARADRDRTVQDALKHNADQDEKLTKIKSINFRIEKAEDVISDLHKTIKELQSQLNIKTVDLNIKTVDHKKLIAERDQLPVPADKKPTDIPIAQPKTESTAAIIDQIAAAETTNKQATLYQQAVAALAKFDAARKLYSNAQAKIDKIEADRIEYIKSCNLPFSNISIDDAGGVLINDRPFSETYFSKGEILRIGIKLAAASDPKLKYIYVPDSQSIDEKNREKLFSELVEAGFQIIAEYVDTKKQKDHDSILLRESKVVESYDDENDLNSL